MGRASPERPPLVEVGPVPEAWVDGVEVLDLGGGSVRLFFFKDRRLPGDESANEREIKFEAVTNLGRLGPIAAVLQALVSGAVEHLTSLLQ